MSWKIIFTKKAQKQINNLDKSVQSRIKKAILEKLMVNPDLFIEPLTGDFTGYYKFRIGDYRLICSKENEELTIIIIELGHRSEVYK
ncbi:MAG: mRNA interferase RelE/StbE [Rickettsiales bacterium]|jgi:mRNA interferase RelE/StbE